MKKWTVLLLRPDYLAEIFGHDTFRAFVEAETPAEALAELLARQPRPEADSDLA